jgi:ligand-binding sensor domain-containing protein/signal transduction histidine kinase
MKCGWRESKSTQAYLKWLAAGVLLLGPSHSSQAADPPLRYDIRVWQTDEGLPQNSVTALAQTPEGYLWVGTREGLARFDGVRFTTCENSNLAHLRHTPINALAVTREGALWIASDAGGLTQIHQGVVRRFLKSDGLADNQVQCLLETRDGTLWIGSETGLTRYRAGRLTTFDDGRLHNNSIKAFSEDRKGILRIATVTGLVSIDAAGNIRPDNFDIGPVSGVLKAVCADREGRLWLGATDGLVCLTDGKRGSFAANKTLPEKITTVIQEDRAGQLWIGTYNGLTRRLGGEMAPWWLNKVGVSDVVNVIFEDREQNLWVGGRDGLYRLSPTRFVTLTTQDGLSYNNVTSVCEDRQGVMWFGTWGGGVNRWEDGRFTAITETNGLTHDTVLSLCARRDGSLLVGMDFAGGLNQLTLGLTNDFTRTNGLIPAAIRVIHEDRTGTIWVGTSRGLNTIRGEQIDTFTVSSGLPSSNVTAICESRSGALWIGTEAGLSRANVEEPSRFSAVSVSGVYVNALYEDSATNLWVGTRGAGVSRLRDGKVWTYTTREGLFSDEVFEILEDDAGYLWLSCPRGIFRISRQQFDALDAGQITHLNSTTFGREDGLATVQCNGVAKPAGWKSSDGRLWFATIRGVVMVEPRIKLNELAPTVAVEEFVVDQQVLRRACDSMGAASEPLHVPAGSGRMAIHFTALSLQSPEKNRFKYRLKGFDSDWVEAGHQRTAYYNNVTPGRVHQFEVLGCNNDGVWAAQSAQIAFRIAPHFWQTWWFRSVLVALSIAVVALIYRARVARLRALENLRIRIAADLHDDVGSRLTKVAMVTELADREMAKGDPAKPHVQNIIRTVRDITRAMDEIVWTINPRNDTLENLANYIFHYAQEYFQDTGVKCRLDLPTELPDGRVSTEERHNLFMAVKEALNNILKHAGATEVRIALSLAEGMMVITIGDNGRGYHALKPDPTGDGLRNMRQRLEKIGGRFEIARNADGGTLITMRLPGKWS